MTTAEHAPLPSSSAHMWRYCHGWRRLNGAGYLLPDNTDGTLEGNAAHWVMARELANIPTAYGSTDPAGTLITEEMFDGAAMFADAIGQPRDSLHVEERAVGEYVHRDNWGTPDVWRLAQYFLDVWDYKYGHRYVDAVGNWQLINYAICVVTALRLPPDSKVRVRLTIVQPRCYVAAPVRSWELSLAELITLADELRDAARANDDPTAQCTTGSYCRDCKARHACQAHLASGGACIDLTGESVPVRLSGAALGRQLALIRQAQERLKSIETGLTAQGMAMARDGQRVPGFSLRQGTGRTVWDRPVDEVVALGAMLGVNVAKPDTITPAQAIKAGLPAEVVEAYSKTPSGAVTFEADGTKFERIFGVQSEPPYANAVQAAFDGIVQTPQQ